MDNDHGITDELREYVSTADRDVYTGKLLAIADRIDAALAERYVELPKDANGEYIHIGDEMEGVDKYDSLREVMGRVIMVSFKADERVDVVVETRNYGGKTWCRAYLDPCTSLYSHHHAPTVEDVLLDMHRKLSDVSELYDVDSDELEDEYTRIIAEYAAKLQLVGDAE